MREWPVSRPILMDAALGLVKGFPTRVVLGGTSLSPHPARVTQTWPKYNNAPNHCNFDVKVKAEHNQRQSLCRKCNHGVRIK